MIPVRLVSPMENLNMLPYFQLPPCFVKNTSRQNAHRLPKSCHFVVVPLALKLSEEKRD
jgi:hypothetical protein